MLAVESGAVVRLPAIRKRVEITEVDATRLDGKLDLLLAEAAWTRTEVVKMTGELGSLRDMPDRLENLAVRVAALEQAQAAGHGANTERNSGRTILIAVLALIVSAGGVAAAIVSAAR